MTEETNVKNPSLFGIITSPSVQFERIKERPKIWVAMLIVTLLFVFGTWLSTLGIDMTEIDGVEMDEESIAFVQIFTTIGTVIGGLIIPILTVLISSFIYWIIAKLAKSEVSFQQLFSMNTYIMIISAIGLILNSAITAFVGVDINNTEVAQFTSLGSLLGSEGVLGAVFINIEVFAIWSVVLTAIGLYKVADFSKSLAWTTSIVFFVIGIVFAMIGAALSGFAGV